MAIGRVKHAAWGSHSLYLWPFVWQQRLNKRTETVQKRGQSKSYGSGNPQHLISNLNNPLSC